MLRCLPEKPWTNAVFWNDFQLRRACTDAAPLRALSSADNRRSDRTNGFVDWFLAAVVRVLHVPVFRHENLNRSAAGKLTAEDTQRAFVGQAFEVDAVDLENEVTWFDAAIRSSRATALDATDEYAAVAAALPAAVPDNRDAERTTFAQIQRHKLRCEADRRRRNAALAVVD